MTDKPGHLHHGRVELRTLVGIALLLVVILTVLGLFLIGPLFEASNFLS